MSENLSLIIKNGSCYINGKLTNTDIGLFDATKIILSDYNNLDDILVLYETEKVLLPLMIHENYYKKDASAKYILYEFIELFLLKKVSIKSFDLYSYFINKINKVKRFNLDEESLFIEFKDEILNG